MLITDDTRIIDLTVGQFRKILSEGGFSGNPSPDAFARGMLPAIDTIPIEKLSEITGWSKSCIYKKCSLRKIPHHKVGKELRFNMAEINAWIKAQKRKTGD